MENTGVVLSPFEQTNAHQRVSNKYAFVSTQQIINDLGDLGWLPDKTSAVNSRKYRGFQKHMVRFVHPDFKIGDDDIELVLINGHHGMTAIKLMLGIFRSICLNGLVAGEQFESYRIVHTGYAKEKLNEIVAKLLSQVDNLKTVVTSMKSRQLTESEVKEFSVKAAFIRLDANDPRNILADESTFYRPQRTEDLPTDLWTVFNVLQEGIMKGGIKYTYEAINKKEETVTRKGSTRKIRNIDTAIDVNKQLFDLANEYLVAA